MLGAMVLGAAGCGTFVAERMVQAPNTYPTWVAPKARVMLGFSPKFLSNFPAEYVEVGPPTARLCYRVVEPADYQMTETSTNWMERGKRQFEFNFSATVPGKTNAWSITPRGTVVLLHGYGLAQFSMAPWAVRLAQEGWRCVLVDLRGHGKSSGKQIYYGVYETADLSSLLNQLASEHRWAGPVSVMGESYGGALALRWKTEEPRVGNAVAIAPYAVLSNAVINISHEYEGWAPRKLTDIFLNAGLKQLPAVLEVKPGELDTTTVLKRNPVRALFIAASDDHIIPLEQVRNLEALAKPGSELLVEPDSMHETVTYFFDDLVPPVVMWLERPVEKQIN
jgi:pimeloyl-ACP methyl ester carboxylesterase